MVIYIYRYYGLDILESNIFYRMAPPSYVSWFTINPMKTSSLYLTIAGIYSIISHY